MISNFYLENEETYIKGFAVVMKEMSDHEFTTDEAREYFKRYMYDYKNIKVDFRQKFWRVVFHKGMTEAGFKFCGLPSNF